MWIRGQFSRPDPKRRRLISVFVAAWLGLFFYESLRLPYLSPAVGFELPKVKLLFPPAGWIMFYRIDEADGRAEVYGYKGRGEPELIDPRRIFETRWLGYDNIRRNVMVSVLPPSRAPAFCAFVSRKLPEYEVFSVHEAWVPSVLERPHRTLRRLSYACDEALLK